MREIELKGKVYAHTKYAVDAIAWATNRRGHNAWEADDVVSTIYQYLERNHVRLVTKAFNGRDDVLVNRAAIRRAMLRLVEDNYARLKNSQSGRYVTSFEFMADVVLTGHSVDRNHEDGGMREHDVSRPIKSDIELPLPKVPFQRYRWDEVDALLQQHNQVDPDGHTEYIDRLIDTLRGVLNG